jgi:hypothetical protein
MVFMAFWDMVSSSMFAISTIPMPKDVIYPYGGPSFGNIRTCEAQAFLIWVGIPFTSSTNMLLNIYYLCTVRYKINEDSFRKYAQIFLVVATCAILPLPIFFAATGFFNPHPFKTVCCAGPYPYDCYDGTDIPCIRGGSYSMSNLNTLAEIYAVSIFGLQFVVLIMSMILIVLTFHSSDRAPARKCERATSGTNDLLNLETKKSMTRVVMQQAMMYIFAYLLTIPLLIAAFYEEHEGWSQFAIAKQVLAPLQGFFNALIFIYHKIENLQRLKPQLSFWDSLSVVLCNPSQVPHVIISGISLVESSSKNAQGVPESAPSRSETSPNRSVPSDLVGSAKSYPSEPSFEPSLALSNPYVKVSDAETYHGEKEEVTRSYYQAIRDNLERTSLSSNRMKEDEREEQDFPFGNAVIVSGDLSTIFEDKQDFTAEDQI